MGWIILLIIGYAPLFYGLNRRVRKLEAEIEALKSKQNL